MLCSLFFGLLVLKYDIYWQWMLYVAPFASIVFYTVLQLWSVRPQKEFMHQFPLADYQLKSCELRVGNSSKIRLNIEMIKKIKYIIIIL